MALPLLPIILMALGGAAAGASKTEAQFGGGGGGRGADYGAKMAALGEIAGRKKRRDDWIVDPEEKSAQVQNDMADDQLKRKQLYEGRWA